MAGVRRTRVFLVYGALVFWALFILVPMVWVVLTSLKESQVIFAYPPQFAFAPTLQSYRTLLFSGSEVSGLHFQRYFWNSVMVAMGTTILTVLVAALAAFALGRFLFFGRKLVSTVILTTRLLPPIAAIIPLFLLMSSLGVLDTRFALITAYTALNLPLAVLILTTFFARIDREIEEAAQIEGAGTLRIFWSILMPLIAPGIVSAGISTFIVAWNDFSIAFVLTNENAATLPLLVVSFVTDIGTLWGPMSATGTLMLVPPIVFVVFFSRWLLDTFTVGPIK